jgi:hypothetical protein
VTRPRPEDGDQGRRRIRPYLSTPAGEDPYPVPEPAAQRARPFILTAGRVEATDPYVGLESQVTTLSTVQADHLAPELRAILELCAQSQSVAEISARLRLHLGVTQILVGDLRAAGLVDVHTVDITHDPDIILRVIHGLRALR